MKIFGKCVLHKWVFTKAIVMTFLDCGEDWQYYKCSECGKTKIKKKHIWCR